MEKTNSPHEKVTEMIIAFVFISLLFFVMLAQMAVSVEVKSMIAGLFSH